MNKKDLQDRYRSRGDEELLDTYKNRHEYTEEAREALAVVIEERGLGTRAAEMDAYARKEETERAAKEHALAAARQKAYEERAVGGTEQFKAAVEKKLGENGDYMAGEMVSGRFRALRILLVSLTLCTLPVFVLSLFKPPPFDHGTLIFGLATLALVLPTVPLFRNAKARFRLYAQEPGAPVFELVNGARTFRAAVPFRYVACWYRISYRSGAIRVSHPVLALAVTDAQGETVVLHGNLTAFDDPPPGWPELSETEIPARSRTFHEKAFKKVDIFRLKKILDHLHA